MATVRALLSLAALASATAAFACIWDSDTLAEEARGKNIEDVYILTGRFERNPPLYYEMRLERLTERIRRSPKWDLNLYDDVAVAAERLGHHADAIAWMEKKRAQMAPLTSETNPVAKAQWYRYYANLGTFWAHKWASESIKDPQDIERARQAIRKAIEINPDAHFGREIYQLHALDWIAAGGKDKEGESVTLSRFIDLAEGKDRFNGMDDKSLQKRREGLAGLIRLGAAWKSVDVTFAYGESLSNLAVDDERFSEALRYLARQRLTELQSEGSRSLFPESWPSEGDLDHVMLPTGPLRDNVREEYKALRENAEKWQANRTQFMMARLQKGRHPDTDPHFWDGYQEVPAHVISSDLPLRSRLWNGQMVSTLAVAGVITVLVSILGWIVLRNVRRSLTA